MALSNSGRHYTYEQTEFWADQGMIWWRKLESPSNDVETLTIKSALHRAQTWIDLRNMYEGIDATRVSKLQNAIEALVHVIREAKAQGDPMDPRVDAEKRNLRGRPFSYSESPSTGLVLPPNMPMLSPADYAIAPPVVRYDTPANTPALPPTNTGDDNAI